MKAETLIIAYLFSVLVGIPITLGWSAFLYWLLAKRTKPTESTERIWWLTMLTGIIERAIITTLIIWTPKFLPAFIGGWTALKVAGGWGLLKTPSTVNRATFTIGLLGSVVSFAWAIGFSLYAAPSAIGLLNK